MYRIVCLLCLAVLAGCVHQPQITPPPDLQAHQARLAEIQSWQIDGKLGIRSNRDSGSASLRWQQTPVAYDIFLSGPLGQKRMEIHGTKHQVELRQSGEPPLRADSAEALIKKAAGWTLPVSQLSYWVRGIPAPKSRITRLEQNEQGLISLLQQEGWTITYNQYQDRTTTAGNFPLPGKIIAEYKDVRLILVIRVWALEPAA